VIDVGDDGDIADIRPSGTAHAGQLLEKWGERSAMGVW